MKRRYPTLVLVIAAFAAAIAAARTPIAPEAPTFSVSASGWMPSAPAPSGLTETWFCPGVPASGVDGAEGAILIANRLDERLVGTVLLLNDREQSLRLELEVDPWSSATVDLDELLPGAMVGAVIEVEGGGALVEQQAVDPAGNSVAACSNATSDTWYLADGFTVEGSLNQIVLTNPYEQTVVANLEFATREGSRRPNSYRGLTVPARSIRIVDLGAPGAGAQSEPILAVTVEVSRGRLVVGRSQRFLGGGRLGTQVTLASPALRDQWWFADGAKGPGISQRFSIYNPTGDRVEVDVIFLGIDAAVDVAPIVVEAREVATFDPALVPDLPEGRHATVFATSTAESAIVVERALTRAVDDAVGTSVLAGATPRQDGHVATTWFLPAGPGEPATEALIVYNGDLAEGLVSVYAVGTSGPVPVDGLQDLRIAGAAFLVIDLTDPVVLGRQLVIESSARVFVERAYPNGRDNVRTSSWAVPAG